MRPQYKWQECMSCEAHYIEDCKYQGVDLEGKHLLPDYCYREDLIRDSPKLHDEKIQVE